MTPFFQRKALIAFATVVSSLGVNAPALAQAPPVDLGGPAEVSIPNTRAIDFVSSVNGHLYRMNVALPAQPPPAAGYRVLYIFDGNHYFGSVTEAVRANGATADVVVVGIGYPDTEAFIAQSDARHGPPSTWYASLSPQFRALVRERQYDLTLPMTEAQYAAQTAARFPAGPAPYTAAGVGGLDQLLETIEADVKPRVAALTTIDPTHQALFGHSLGGLAVLRAMFRHPDSYHAFIAASSSIWWNDRAVLVDEAAFIRSLRGATTGRRLLLTVGEGEGAGMTADSQGLAARLQAAARPDQLMTEFVIFPEQGHDSSYWSSIGPALQFAFGDANF